MLALPTFPALMTVTDFQVVVKDAVPLFHTCTLAPLLETSATMVDAHATSNGLSIVGFYQVLMIGRRFMPSINSSLLYHGSSGGYLFRSIVLLLLQFSSPGNWYSYE